MKCNAGFDLNLQSLTTLYVNVLCDDIRLNCPNLRHLLFYLVYPSFSRPAHYKQIRTLTCHYYHPFIKGLENLETIYCAMLWNQETGASTDFVKCFPRLNFLYAFFCSSGYDLSIAKEKAELKRDDLAVYHVGKINTEFRKSTLTAKGHLNYSIFDCGNVQTAFYRNELAKLAPTLPTFSALHYDQNFRTYDRQFYQKLINVQALTIVQGPVPQCTIVEMIECIGNIVILMVIEGEHLDQSFYNLLPDRYPHLRVIQIDNSALDELDLNFLFRLNDLYRAQFKKWKSVKNHPVYKRLAKKLGKKKKEISQINGDFLFEMDRFKLRMRCFSFFYMRQDWVATGVIRF